MSNCKSILTVLFQDPFWIALYERTSEGKYEVCKITFGPEPKDYEVYDFFLNNWSKLRFSSSIDAKTIDDKKINPKRMQRKINKQQKNTGIGTKAQQALKLQHEKFKLERKSRTRKQKESEKKHQFELRQAKKKAKHRGH